MHSAKMMSFLRGTNYLIVDETIFCLNLTVKDGGSIIITNGANINVDGNLAVGGGASGIFKINGGSCIVSGDFFTELGSNINITGGAFNFTNWKRTSYNQLSAGNITLSNGTINASKSVYFSPKDATGTMNGPFIFNVGYGFSNSDSTWRIVTGGTINLLGNVETENGGLFHSSNSSTSAVAYNLTINAPGHKIFLGYGNKNLFIKNNLTILGGDVRADEVKMINISGNLTIGLHCHLRTNYDIFLAGNWINNAGSVFPPPYISGNTTVFFTGTNQIISGVNIFYNLTKVTTSAAKLTFAAGVSNKTNIRGILKLQGASGQLLSLRSATDGTQWEIDPQGSRTLGFLDVKDSKNTNATTITACNLINSGNNTNWDLPPASADSITGKRVVCKGTSNQTYSVPDITDATSYIWTLPTGATGTSTSNSISVIFGSSATSGDIKVKGHNTCGDGTESKLAITVNSVPSLAGSITGNDTVCKGTSNITYTVPAISDATTYIWTLPTGATGTSTTNSISLSFGSSATSGDIKVKGHNTCGDGTESKLAITVNSVPSLAGTISGNETVCKGTSNITYTVPAIFDATTYIWTLPTGATGTSTTNSISVSFDNTAASGDIKVKGHNDCGDGVENKLPVIVNAVPATPVISLNNGILQSNAPDGTQWYKNNTIVSNAVNPTLVPESKGDYHVIVTLNYCISMSSNVVSFNPTGVKDISSSDNIKVYPNPTSGLIEISLTDPLESDYKIEVFDLTHIILTFEKQKNEKTTQIDLSTYPSGMYFINISSKDKFYHFRIIKL